MPSSFYTPESKILADFLAEKRHKVGLKQRELAERLDVPHSWVGNVEVGQRRVDMVEFFWICEALGISPSRAGAEVLRRMKAL